MGGTKVRDNKNYLSGQDQNIIRINLTKVIMMILITKGNNARDMSQGAVKLLR